MKDSAKLEKFINELSRMPVPTSIISNGIIVDGISNKEWTVEDMAASAFDKEILDTEMIGWDEAIKLITEIMKK